MEAAITINGTRLSDAQSMVLRVALTQFASVIAEEGLGEDEHGKIMVIAYLARADEIFTLMRLK